MRIVVGLRASPGGPKAGLGSMPEIPPYRGAGKQHLTVSFAARTVP